MDKQSEFNFVANNSQEGYTRWLAGRRVQTEELARRIHLPIGHQVEIWLYGGIRLRGKLRLKEEMVFIAEDRVRHLELIADQVPFIYRDMESCVRID
jgi:hypothetical protein